HDRRRELWTGDITSMVVLAGLIIVLPSMAAGFIDDSFGGRREEPPDARTTPSVAGPQQGVPEVPALEVPAQHIMCGTLDVCYDPADAPEDLDLDVQAAFGTIAVAAGRPPTMNGPVTGMQIHVVWSSDAAPAAGSTETPAHAVIDSATIRLNRDL